jgi:hypothetical protein
MLVRDRRRIEAPDGEWGLLELARLAGEVAEVEYGVECQTDTERDGDAVAAAPGGVDEGRGADG